MKTCMKFLMGLIAAGLMATSAHAMLDTLDDCVDAWGSPYGAYIDHLRIGHNDFGVCIVYEWPNHKVWILRHDVGVLKAGTVCDEMDFF
jgi:hypothetical protein